MKQKQTTHRTKVSSLQSFAMGAVALSVRDMDRMKQFYHRVIGLAILSETEQVVHLGHGDVTLVTLHDGAHLSGYSSSDAGLYHLALVFGSQTALADRVKTVLTHAAQQFVGSADHLVSEAFYFTDPEGNGIELYTDRQRSLWQWKDGQLQMASLYIDPISYLRTHGGKIGHDTSVQMGHVHLKVGDIERAQKFYVDILGFDQTALLPGALFVSRDGYHHHLGMNTWESAGAGARIPARGLHSYTMHVSKAVLTNMKKSLQKHNIAFEETKEGITLHDPWKNQIHILLQSE
jgi:catechol 2,3-dioxygenase